MFGVIDADLRERLLRDAPLRQFTDGQIIQQRGDKSTGFWVIDSGRVTIGQYRASGDLRALALLGPGDSYGELSVFARNTRAVDAIADGPAALHWIASAPFEALLDARPDQLRKLLGAVCEELQEVLGTLAGTGSTDSATRLAGLLSNLAGGDADNNTARVTMGQQELGELLGLTRATVSKVLRQFEREGIVKRGYREITILNSAALRTAADG